MCVLDGFHFAQSKTIFTIEDNGVCTKHSRQTECDGSYRRVTARVKQLVQEACDPLASYEYRFRSESDKMQFDSKFDETTTHNCCIYRTLVTRSAVICFAASPGK